MPEPRTFSILRAAAAANDALRLLPATPPAPRTDLRGADPLADIALRLCVPLLATLSDIDRDRTGLIIGTAFGSLQTDLLFDRSRRDAAGRYASPAAFSRTLPSTVAAELSLKLSLRGPSLILSRGHASTALALRRAASWMRHFDLASCIAGGMDWREDGDCKAALLLLSRGPAQIAELVISEKGDETDNSLDSLIDWIHAPTHTLLGSGVELTAANSR